MRILSFFAALCLAGTAGATTPNPLYAGQVLEPGFPSGDITVTGDLKLRSLDKLILDSDVDANNYITGNDSTVQFWVEGARPAYLTAGRLLLGDDIQLTFGTGADFLLDYDSVATRLELNNLTGLVLYVEDGTQTLSTNGGRNIGTRIIDCDDGPYTVVSTDEVITADLDSGTGAPCALTINLPAAACGVTIGGTEKDSCRILRIKNIGASTNITVEGNGTEEIDNALNQTVGPGSSLTIVDLNQTDYHWIIE
jgi:hypothetical protein